MSGKNPVGSGGSCPCGQFCGSVGGQGEIGQEPAVAAAEQLTPEEKQNILSILREEIDKHTIDCEILLLAGKISQPEANWRRAHADHLVTAVKKLFPDFVPPEY